MRTNTPRQQATRRMTADEKATKLAADIAQDHAMNEDHSRRFQATQAMWQHAAAAGLTPAERYSLDMALARGDDPAYLNTTF